VIESEAAVRPVSKVNLGATPGFSKHHGAVRAPHVLACPFLSLLLLPCGPGGDRCKEAEAETWGGGGVRRRRAGHRFIDVGRAASSDGSRLTRDDA
jgi:hypothetical protein